MVNIVQPFLTLHFSINCMWPLVTLGFPWLILFYLWCIYDNGDTITNPYDIGHTFNNHFAYIAETTKKV